MGIQGAQLLREMFAEDQSDRPPITLATLALSLNQPVSRLIPLAREGYLAIHSEGEVVADSYVDCPPERALLWLRQWLQPARSKPLFSLADLSELMKLPSKKVMAIAAANDVPVTWDEALGGHVFSTWATKQMLMIGQDAGSGRSRGQKRDTDRYDRQALLWRVMEGDPSRIGKLPSFSERLEDEIERVAKLDEPMRAIRTGKLLDAFRDVGRVAEAADNRAGAEEMQDNMERVRLRLVS